MTEKIISVECFSGYKGDERPVRVLLGREMVDVAEVEERWYSPGSSYFRVKLTNGERYVLRRTEAQDCWIVEAFRTAEVPVPPRPRHRGCTRISRLERLTQQGFVVLALA